MHNEWPTQKQDMQTADDIVNKHIELNGGGPLGFIELVMPSDENKDKKIELKIPDWISELLLHFRDQYGYEYGHAITSKVLTKLILKNETLH